MKLRIALLVALTTLQMYAWPSIGARSTWIASTNKPQVTDWGTNNKVLYNLKNGSSYYDMHAVDPDGTSNDACLIGGAGCAVASANGKSATLGNWCNASQRFIAYTKETTGGGTANEPGAAFFYSLWITDYPALAHPTQFTFPTGSDGELLPRFSRDCAKIAWSTLRSNQMFIEVCDFVPGGSTPNIANCKTSDPVPPSWYYEVEGWCPDNSCIYIGVGAGSPKSIMGKLPVNSDNTTGAFATITDDKRAGAAASWTEFRVAPYGGTLYPGGFMSSSCGLNPFMDSGAFFPKLELFYVPNDGQSALCVNAKIGYRLTGTNWVGSSDYNGGVSTQVDLGALSPDGSTLLVNYTQLISNVVVREISKYSVKWPSLADRGVAISNGVQITTQ